ncbi:hypothetical protein B0H34DRAFT_698055 [Crassisporium funariophilum]|nr:hypothetical protein B0H34DRAFT_698055 [Crassisporium funariophilum]
MILAILCGWFLPSRSTFCKLDTYTFLGLEAYLENFEFSLLAMHWTLSIISRLSSVPFWGKPFFRQAFADLPSL